MPGPRPLSPSEGGAVRAPRHHGSIGAGPGGRRFLAPLGAAGIRPLRVSGGRKPPPCARGRTVYKLEECGVCCTGPPGFPKAATH